MSAVGRDLEISGQRVALAPFREGDFDAVHAFASDPEVCAFTSWGPNAREDTRAFIVEAIQPTRGSYLLAVMLGGDIIGSAAVWTTSGGDRSGELGFTLRRDCWGRGYGTEVAALLLCLGFERLGLERIAGTCAPENIGSIRVLEKAGLRYEGLLRGHVSARGLRRDSLIFGRLVTDA